MVQDKRYVYKSLLLTNSGFSSNFKIIEKRLESSVKSFFTFLLLCGIFISLNTLQYFLETAKEPDKMSTCVLLLLEVWATHYFGVFWIICLQ